MNRNAKASVFEDLFSDAEAQWSLYRALHPEDEETRMEDVEGITLSHVLLRGRYNDLGLMIRNRRLIVLMEAQSTWSVNVIPRCVMYLADTWNRYGVRNGFNWYGKRKVALPEAELYVVYTGKEGPDKTEITLSEEFFDGRKGALEVTVKVLHHTGENDVLDQYITFCQVLNEQREKYPDDGRQAVAETIRVCYEGGILEDYLRKRGEEVVNIMLTLFDEEQIRRMEILDERRDAMEEGVSKGKKEERSLICNLMQRLFADGRMSDAERAVEDDAYCQELLKKYGLSE